MGRCRRERTSDPSQVRRPVRQLFAPTSEGERRTIVSCWKSACLASILFLFATMTFLGASTVSLSGNITDPSGAAVEGAVITLYSSVALQRSTASAANGSFSFSDLMPGMYVMDCSAEGFQKQSRRIDISAQGIELSVQLTVAGIHQEVSVVA